jgi:hypothetical protein
MNLLPKPLENFLLNDIFASESVSPLYFKFTLPLIIFVVNYVSWRILVFKLKEEEEELRALGPGVNEVSFRARPHLSVHRTLGVDTGATGPL